MQQTYEPEQDISAPTPVLYGRASDFTQVEPSIVRDTRTLCIAAMVLYGIPLLMGLYDAISSASNGRDAGSGMALVAFYGCVLAVAVCLYRGLLKRKSIAWRVQTVISIIGVFGIPIGTLIHGYILSKWFKPEVKEWFGIPAIS